MRTVAALLVFLGLVGAAIFWPTPEVAPPHESPGPTATPPGATAATCSIVGRISLHGYPVVATISARRIRDFAPRSGIANEWWHPTGWVEGRRVGTGRPVGTAESDEDGRFRIDGLPPAEYHIDARAPDGASAQWKLELRAPGEIVRTSVDLTRTGNTRFGRLTWSDGRPFRGVISIGERGTETSPDGRFVLTDLPRRSPSLEVFPIAVCQPGVLYRVVGDLDSFGSRELDLVVDEGFVRMEGHVLSAEDGTPLGGVPVVALGGQPVGRGGCFSMTRTRPDGAFTLWGHPGGNLAAGGDDHLTLWRSNAPPVDSAVFRLKRRPVVAGRVVDTDRRPVAGAPIWLYELPGDADDAPERVWHTPVRSDDAGRFRFAVHQTGGLMVAVFGDGWMSRDLPRGSPGLHNPLFLAHSSGEEVELELVVVPSPSVAGRVTDHEGNPVVGFRVDVWEEMNLSLRGDFWRGWLDGDREAVTGPYGRYRVPTIVPRTPFRITEFSGIGDRTETDWMWPAGEMTADLALAPPYRRWVEVRVLSEADGRPIPSARVSVGPAGEPDRSYADYKDTGPDGRALLGPLPDGPLFAAVHHPDHVLPGNIPVPGSEGEAERMDLTIRLARGAILAGRVLLPDGTPAGRAGVRISVGPAWVTQGSTGPSGRFSFRTLKAGKYTVKAWWFAPDRAYYEARLTAETDRDDLVLNLELDRTVGVRPDPPPSPRGGGELSGRVLDPDGAPVCGARVAGPKVTWTDRDGRFTFTGLADEAHLLTVVGPPHLFLRDPVSAQPGDAEVEIRLAPAAAPTITVLDFAGKPVPRTTVSVEPPELEDELVCRLTDADGRVEFGGLDPKRPLLLTIEPPEDREDLSEMEFEDWFPADRTIRMPGIRTLTGVVRDADGFGVGRASLWYREVGAVGVGWEEVDVEDDGSFTAEELPATALELMVGVNGSELDDPGLVSVMVPAGETRTEIEIDGRPWIGIRIPAWPKDAKSRVHLTWGGGAGGARWLAMPPDGRLRFHGVPGKGKTFTLYAGPLPGGRMVFEDDLASDVDHELTLRQGKTISGKIIAPEVVEVFSISIYSHRLALHELEDKHGPHDRYRIEGLPDDSYLVCVLAATRTGKRRSYKGEVEVQAGESEDLKLELWKD